MLRADVQVESIDLGERRNFLGFDFNGLSNEFVMHSIHVAAVYALLMPVDSNDEATLQILGMPNTVATVGDGADFPARSDPDVRISIGIDPLEWIKPSRY